MKKSSAVVFVIMWLICAGSSAYLKTPDLFWAAISGSVLLTIIEAIRIVRETRK